MRRDAWAPLAPAALVSGPQPVAEASIAVLPFLNLSSDPENEYFSDGMTDEIINALAQVPGLRVPARTSCFMFKGKNVDARQIGERLKVSTLLEGSLRKAGERIRLTVQLINAADGYHMWSHTYERTLADVFALQDELTRAIVPELTSRMVETAGAPAARGASEVTEAYTLYLQGCYFRSKQTSEGFQTAVDYFRRATECDPKYAMSYAQLAYCHALLGFDTFGTVPPLEAMPRAKAAVSRALGARPPPRRSPRRARSHRDVVRLGLELGGGGVRARAESRRALPQQSTYGAPSFLSRWGVLTKVGAWLRPRYRSIHFTSRSTSPWAVPTCSLGGTKRRSSGSGPPSRWSRSTCRPSGK